MCRKRKEANWVHLGRNESLWAIVKILRDIIYVDGQKEVEISHDVTFDEDMALGKINNLPILRKNKEIATGN